MKPTYDLVFVNGSVVTASETIKTNICISGDKVVAWEKEIPAADTVIDCRNLLVMAGAVDMHFHCRTPGRSEREDFDSATKAAAHGGVTTITEMPIAKPSPHDVPSLRHRIEHASQLAVADFAFYGAGATMNPGTAMDLAREGVVGFKIFLHEAPKGREDEFNGLCAPTSAEVLRSLETNALTGLLTAVHAEDDGIIRELSGKWGGEKSLDWHAQLESRPPEAEELAVCCVALAARRTGAKAHICHVSSKQAAEAIGFLQSQGCPITAETCPHYLLMDTESMVRFGTSAKVNPSLRTAEHREGLLKALKQGILCTVASDHAPFLKAEKGIDFLKAPGGMPSIEFFGPALWNGVHAGLWNWNDLAKWTSEVPAKLLGLYPKKGNLYPGGDADIILVDPNGTWNPTLDELFTKSRESATPLLREYRSKLLGTYVRGKQVYDIDKGITVNEGYGEWQRPIVQ